MAVWSTGHESSLHHDLNLLPENFPILSIRGWKDRMVPLKAIEGAFEGHDQLGLEILSLPGAGHLKGLKDFPGEYIPRVTKFLNAKATPL